MGPRKMIFGHHGAKIENGSPNPVNNN